MQSEQHVVYRLMAGGGQGGPSLHGIKLMEKGCSEWKLTTVTVDLKKGALGDQV